VELPLDVAEDGGHSGDDARHPDASANGRLHWVPMRVTGLRERMAAISAWIAAAHPDAVVVDVSVEVALLTRLHGVPVVSVALPGDRGDAAHRLGFDVSTAIVAAWPADAAGMITGLSPEAGTRLHPVGAISRFPDVGAGDDDPPQSPGASRRVLVLAGAGGDEFDPAVLAAAGAATPGWEFEHLGGSSGRWVDDPRAALRRADVVLTHAGQNALADVAAARRPAVVVPQRRPHDEQDATARVIAAGSWPALVVGELPDGDWGDLLARAAALDASGWRRWNDGGGARRAARVIADVADGRARDGGPR
jgi:hypothetical protein